MKYFLFKLFLFLLPILSLAIFFEVLIRKTPNDYVLKKGYLDNHANNVKTLILGSSHSLYGLDPKYFDKQCFNASHVSQTLDYDLAILKKYDHWEQLETVILPISYFSFFERIETTDESWRAKDYLLYYDISFSHQFQHHSEVLSIGLKHNLKKIIDHYIKNQPAISCSDLGWGTNATSENAVDLFNSGVRKAKKHTIADHQCFEKNLLILKEIIKFCNTKNSNIVLFTPPAYKAYIKNLDNDQLLKTITTVNQIAKKYNNCTYINLLEDQTYSPEDFFDADHLNEIGAKKLSIAMNKFIQQ